MSKQATATDTAYPAGWQIKPLSDLLIAGPQNGYSGKCGKDARGTPTLMLTATTSGRLVLTDDTIKRLNETIANESDLFLRPGDVLVQRSNTAELVGTTAVFDGPPGVYVYPDLMIRLRFRDNITGQWFWRYSNSATGRRYYTAVAAGSTGTMPKVSGEALRLMPVPLPPIEEQQAIAQALSDVDDLIHSLERLIAKKRGLKQAAMQKLLTGQTRLPGFGGKWLSSPLGRCCEVVMGQSPPGHSYNRRGSGTPLINGPTEFTDKHPVRIQWTTEPTRFCKRGDLLLCVRGSSTGRTNVADDAYCIGRGVAAIRALGTHDTNFLSYQVIAGVDGILAASAGSTFPSVDAKALRRITISLPSTTREETSIAEVLSDMDAEITALEARLAKTRDLKQGMMQELLTGRTRLV